MGKIIITGGCLAAAGLILGNFGYQFATGQNWSVAIERSWFQLVAVIATSLAILVRA